MSNTMYDTIKNIALIIAPVITFIISILCTFKVIDNEIAISISSAVDTLLGALVIVAKQIYDSKTPTENTTENNAK